MQPLSEKTGWLGGMTIERTGLNTASLAIASYALFGGDKAAAHWLPDQHVAEAWRAYNLVPDAREKNAPNEPR